jgi:hypothetical protein
MAYLQADDKLQQDNQDPNQKLGGQQTDSGGSAIVGGDSANVATGTSTAGIGAGGTGGWTNIQSYLNANKGVDTGADKLLNDNVGGEFSKEKSNLESDATKAKTDAQAQSAPINDVKAHADDYLKQGTNDYTWQGAKGDGYNKALSSFQGALNGQYQGPKNYSYAMGDKAQQYGSNLGSDDAFNNMLGDMYQNKAGGQLSSGGRELQKQLNISNEPLAQTRQKLLADYSGLGNYRDQTVQDTNQALTGAENDYRTGQNSLRDFLTNKATGNESDLAKAESDARSGYQTDYTNKNFQNGTASAQDIQNLQDTEQGDEAAQVKRAQETGDWSSFGYDRNGGINNAEFMKNLYGGLPGFYKDEDAKYGNTGDEQKRQYNLIQEILGNSAHKDQGFKVRG